MPVTVPEPDRAGPGRLGDERAMLDYYRASLLRKCAGLLRERIDGAAGE